MVLAVRLSSPEPKIRVPLVVRVIAGRLKQLSSPAGVTPELTAVLATVTVSTRRRSFVTVDGSSNSLRLGSFPPPESTSYSFLHL